MMKITQLTIYNYGRIVEATFNFDKVSVIETPYINELIGAIEIVQNNNMIAKHTAKIFPSEKTVFICDMDACDKKFTIKIEYKKEDELVEDRQIINGELSQENYCCLFANKCLEEEITGVFTNDCKVDEEYKNCAINDYKNYFSYYMGCVDNGFSLAYFKPTEKVKYFRCILNKFIRQFKPIWVNEQKGIYLKLLRSGGIETYKDYGGKPKKYCLSASDNSIFNFACCLIIGDFWKEIGTIRDLHFEKKPLVAVNLLERMSVSFDLVDYIKKTKQDRQIIILKKS